MRIHTQGVLARKKKQVHFEKDESCGQKYGTFWVDFRRSVKDIHMEEQLEEGPSPTVIVIGSPTYNVLKIIEGLILLYNSTVTPALLALGVEAQLLMLVYLSIALDVVYLGLMICKFRTCYYNTESLQEHNPRQIFLHYLTGWFLLDFVSVFPLEHLSRFKFDLSIVRVFNFGYNYNLKNIWFVSESMTCFNRLVEDFRPKFRRVLNYLVLLHVLTCLWMYMTWLESDNPLNWRSRYLPGSSLGEFYLQAMYFVLVTASTVGFGDMVPDTLFEYLITITLMHFGVIAYSLICGSIINAIRDEATRRLAKREKKNFVRRLTNEMQINEELKGHLLKNIQKAIEEEGINEDRELLRKLPLTMRSMLSFHLHHEWTCSVPYFQGKSPHFVGELCLYLNQVEIEEGAQLFGRNERPEVIYFLQKGSVQLRLDDGTFTERLNWHVYGEIDFILLNKRRFQFIALEHLKVLRLHRDDYDRIFNFLFPQEGLKMIKSAKNKYASLNNPHGEHLGEEPATPLHGGAGAQPFLRLIQVKKELERVEKGIKSLIETFNPKS